jgi:tetratricopeptide (TPR) repeat protein
VVDRNADWRDEAALFVGDAQAAPNSALVCGNAGSQYLDTYFKADDPRDRAAWLAQARGYSERSIQLDPTAAAAALNLVLIHLEYHDIETAERWRATARALDPGHPAQQRMGRYLAEACVEQGLAEARNRRWDRAEAWLKRALGNDPSHAEAWRYLGGVYFETGALDRARQAWGQSGKPVVWEGF